MFAHIPLFTISIQEKNEKIQKNRIKIKLIGLIEKLRYVNEIRSECISELCTNL